MPGTRYLDLAWTGNATNATAQYLQWSGNGVEWKALATCSAGVRSYRHSGLVVGVTNWYRLRAYYTGGGYSAFSEAVPGVAQ